ncbi:MAG: Enoyl-CoA hydratase/carnithine racemase [Rhodobacteraceae bacterium HLUCCA12]|nr:MAG: Enoyl-CoA hydratase/carnithine racemase [Rhodobacteraceae bacterium HLUCCA12]
MSAVTLHETGGVAWLTLNRPDRCNALDDALLSDLVAALDRLDAPHALVLRAAGRHFSTGGDVARFAKAVASGQGAAYAQTVVGTLNRAIERLAALPCPVIAQVQGALTGGALGLVLAADLVVMDPRAFVQPFYTVVGFAPDGGWTAMLPDRIGAHRARAIQLLNQRIPADQAQALGLAQAVSDDPAAVTDEWLAVLGGHVPGALALTRRLTTDLPALKAGLEAERAAFVDRIETDEVRDGMARFLASLKGG